MALMDFIKKQFIDIIQWTETGDGTLAWRFPMADMEIQNGASLTVRESQMAVFVNEGKVADVFGPGMYKLTTQTLPVLTYLKNWDKLFESPVQERRLLLQHAPAGRPEVGHAPADHDPRQGLRRGAAARLRQLQLPHRRRQAVPHRDLGHARHLHAWPTSTASCAAWCCRTSATRSLPAACPSSTWRPTRSSSRRRSPTQLVPEFAKIGIKLENITVQNVSLPEELQKILDQKIGMGMVGNDMGKFMQYQTAQAIPEVCRRRGHGGGGIAGDAMGLGAGVALGQVLAQNLAQGLSQNPRPQRRRRGQQQPAVAVVSPADVMTTLEKLGELKTKGILTQEEFDAKKAELLKKLV